MANFQTRQGYARARALGQQDFKEGKTLDDNPYKRRGLCTYLWTAGWWEEENEAAIRENRMVRAFPGHGMHLLGGNIARQAVLLEQAVAKLKAETPPGKAPPRTKCEDCGVDLLEYGPTIDTGKGGSYCPECGFSWDDAGSGV